MTDFNLIAARRNTPNWPPLDGDIWTGSNGREWLTDVVVLPGDRAIVGFREGTESCLPRYALEVYGPLTLTHKGPERLRFEQASEVQRHIITSYLAQACWDCGPEGATGPTCGDCTETCWRCTSKPAVGVCCSSHKNQLCHACYRRSHFVEVCVAGCSECAAENLPVVLSRRGGER